MENSRWARIEELFIRAADLPPAERPAFLDLFCERDKELRRELESLLAADNPGAPLVDLSALGTAVRQFAESAPDLIGNRIGRYTITRFIGKGGMGAVYQAVRENDFRMQVAVKLLNPGADTETALNRFLSERQILAELEHPNIARLLDGGSTDEGNPTLSWSTWKGRASIPGATAASFPSATG